VDSNRIKPHARIRITLPLATQKPASCCHATSVAPTTLNFSGGEVVATLMVEPMAEVKTSGVLPDNFEFPNCLKVKSELCSPHSFYQFKLVLCKEDVVYLRFIRI
jgi:hypothetical protein